LSFAVCLRAACAHLLSPTGEAKEKDAQGILFFYLPDRILNLYSSSFGGWNGNHA